MLVKCHECGKSVSTEAATCPNCGAAVRQPQQRAVSSNPLKRHAGIIVLVAIMAAVIIGASISDDKKSQAQAAQREAACRASLQCWGERNLSKAHAYCKSHIEQLALHSVKWTDEGAFDLKFSRFKWLDKDAGTVTFIGDKAEFQNGFGAYTPVIYACDLGDLDKDVPKVLGVRVLGEGRLPPS